MFNLMDWAARHHISLQALGELQAAFGHLPELGADVNPADRESVVQVKVRLSGQVQGFQLFRNNVGAMKDDRGIPVRYGLANDTAALNKVVKSPDLVGWKSEIWIHPESFQPTKIARFVGIECKRGDWPGYNPEDKHERAQQRFLELIVSAGGIGAFSTGALPQ